MPTSSRGRISNLHQYVERSVGNGNFNEEATTIGTTSRREWLNCISQAVATVGAASITVLPRQAAAAAAATTTAVESAGSSSSSSIAEVTSEVPTTTTIHTCDPSVSVWKNPVNGRKVYLLGTAHISSVSAELAGKLVQDVKPEAVFVELDAKRVNGGTTFRAERNSAMASSPSSLPTSDSATKARASDSEDSKQPWLPLSEDDPNQRVIAMTRRSDQAASADTSQKKNPFDFRNKLLGMGAAAVGGAIKTMYRRLDDSGFNAGEEFVIAVREGQKIGSAIVLGDQDVDITMRRLTQALANTDMSVLANADSELNAKMGTLLTGADSGESMSGGGVVPPEQRQRARKFMNEPPQTEEELKEGLSSYVEVMKAKDNVRNLMASVKSLAPEVYSAMVAERDAYMANGLDQLNMFRSIVAVMGIAHIDGVEQILASRGWQNVKLSCARIA